MFDEWFFGMLATGAADWIAQSLGWIRVRFITKPLVLLLLIAWFTMSGGTAVPGGLFFGLALVFSLLGDIFLLDGLVKMNPLFFQAGLGSFLLAQIAYIIALNWGGIPLNLTSLALLAFVAAISLVNGGRVLRALRRSPEGARQAVPVTFYMLALTLMLVSALATLTRPDWLTLPASLVGLGAALFYLSDSVLANNRFVHPLPLGEMIVIVSYHIGQFLITAGVLLQYHS